MQKYTLLIIVLSLKVWGTSQVADRIIVNGDTLSLFNTPLEEKNGQVPDTLLSHPSTPKFFGNDGVSTACWRGYRAVWSIENDSLFLVGILQCHSNKKADIKKYYKTDAKERVFADWFIGTLRIPTGHQIEHAPLGFSLHSIEYRISMIKGRVYQVIENKAKVITEKEIIEKDERAPSKQEIENLEIK